MSLRHDTTWACVVGKEVWAKYDHNPVMLTFRVLACEGDRMLINREPLWTDSVYHGNGVWEVEQASFRLLDC